MPQPYFVPVSPTFSRIAQSSGVSGSTSIVKVLPFILRFAIAYPLIGPIHQLNFARGSCAPKLEQFKSIFCAARVKINARAGKKDRSAVLVVLSARLAVPLWLDRQAQEAHHAAD